MSSPLSRRAFGGAAAGAAAVAAVGAAPAHAAQIGRAHV